MGIETTLLNQLKAEQASFAMQAMRVPTTRDAFEYGHRSGVVLGYELAINLLLSLLNDEKRKDNDL